MKRYFNYLSLVIGLDFLMILIWVLFPSVGSASEWAKTYGGSYYDEARSIQQTSDGGYVVAGWTESFGAGGADILILKT